MIGKVNLFLSNFYCEDKKGLFPIIDKTNLYVLQIIYGQHKKLIF